MRKLNPVAAIFAVVLSFVLAQPVSAQKAKDAADPVLADVNGVSITKSQLEEKFNSLPVQFQAGFKDRKNLLLEDMVNQQLLLQEARKRKLEKDEKVQKAFEQLKQNILVQRMLEVEVMEKVNVTPQEMQEFYNKNKDSFKTPETIHPYHILLPDEAKAKEAEKRLKKGEDFEKVAKEISVCPSAPRGGDLGTVRQGQMVPEFEEAAFKLKVNEISPVVKTQFGYHLIKVTEKEPAKDRSFEEVKPEIEAQLLDQKRRDMLKNYLENLKNQGKVSIYPERLQ